MVIDLLSIEKSSKMGVRPSWSCDQELNLNKLTLKCLHMKFVLIGALALGERGLKNVDGYSEQTSDGRQNHRYSFSSPMSLCLW